MRASPPPRPLVQCWWRAPRRHAATNLSFYNIEPGGWGRGGRRRRRRRRRRFLAPRHAWSILNSIHGPHEGSVSPRNSSLLSFRPSLAPFPLHFILPSTVLPFLSFPFLYIDSWIRGFLDFWVPAFPDLWNPGLHHHIENTEQNNTLLCSIFVRRSFTR